MTAQQESDGYGLGLPDIGLMENGPRPDEITLLLKRVPGGLRRQPADSTEGNEAA